MYKYEYRDSINNNLVNGELPFKSLSEAKMKLQDWLASEFENYKPEYLTIIEL